MEKQKVNIIKKKPDRPIPIKGSSFEVYKEINKYCNEIDKEISYIRSIAIKKSYSLTDGVFIYIQHKHITYCNAIS